MSNALFPTLAGLGWNISKTPIFNNIIQRAVDLTELRGAFASTPIYSFSLGFDLLRDNVANAELRNLFGFVLARQGSFDSFLYLDPDDKTALLEPFGTGDSVTTAFQLTRAFGAFTEMCANVQAAPLIYKAGVLQTVTVNYTVGSTGIVTFTAPPAAAAALTWSGTYYFRCRFNTENTPMDFNQFMRQLWELKQMEFFGSLGTKI